MAFVLTELLVHIESVFVMTGLLVHIESGVCIDLTVGTC